MTEPERTAVNIRNSIALASAAAFLASAAAFLASAANLASSTALASAALASADFGFGATGGAAGFAGVPTGFNFALSAAGLKPFIGPCCNFGFVGMDGAGCDDVGNVAGIDASFVTVFFNFVPLLIADNNPPGADGGADGGAADGGGAFDTGGGGGSGGGSGGGASGIGENPCISNKFASFFAFASSSGVKPPNCL